jgi:uncharacterized protein (TIGR02246 family)
MTLGNIDMENALAVEHISDFHDAIGELLVAQRHRHRRPHERRPHTRRLQRLPGALGGDMTLAHQTSLQAIAERYFKAWEACDADAIAALHAEDTQFWLHSGGGPVNGRDAVRKAFAEIFEQWPEFGFETYRVLYGDGHWVLDWALTAVLTGDDGSRQPVRFDLLDVVTVNTDGLVLRKDTFVDFPQAMASGAGRRFMR